MDMIAERLPGVDLSSLNMIMKPENAAKLADCRISLLDSPTDIGLMVLSWLGIDPATAGPKDYACRIEASKPIREHVATFDNANYLTTLPNKKLCVANTFSGDFSVAKARAADAGIALNLQYLVPKTGAPAWFDVWAILSDAGNVENAHLFPDYMMQPEVMV